MATFWIDGGGGTARIWLLLLVVGGSMAEPDFSCTFNGQPWKPEPPGDWFPKNVVYHPICPGDFKEYFEMWEVNSQFQPSWYDHSTIFSKFNEDIGNNKKKGNQVLYNGLYFSLYGTDEYVFSEDVPANDNIWIWTKNSPSGNPGAFCVFNGNSHNKEHQFTFKERLFINSSHFLDLKVLYEARKQDSGEVYVEKGLCQAPKPIEEIPAYELSYNLREKVKQHCGKNYCAIDMDSDGSSMVMDKEHRIVVHKGGMNLIAKVYNVDNKNYPYYVLRYAGLWFYFPKNLPTFKDSDGFIQTYAKDNKWDNRYVLLPIIGQDEVFFARREKFTTTTTTTTSTTLPPTTAAPVTVPVTTVRTTTTAPSPTLGIARAAVDEETTTPDYEEANSSFKLSINSFVWAFWVMVLVVVG